MNGFTAWVVVGVGFLLLGFAITGVFDSASHMIQVDRAGQAGYHRHWVCEGHHFIAQTAGDQQVRIQVTGPCATEGNG